MPPSKAGEKNAVPSNENKFEIQIHLAALKSLIIPNDLHLNEHFCKRESERKDVKAPNKNH